MVDLNNKYRLLKEVLVFFFLPQFSDSPCTPQFVDYWLKFIVLVWVCLSFPNRNGTRGGSDAVMYIVFTLIILDRVTEEFSSVWFGNSWTVSENPTEKFTWKLCD